MSFEIGKESLPAPSRIAGEVILRYTGVLFLVAASIALAGELAGSVSTSMPVPGFEPITTPGAVGMALFGIAMIIAATGYRFATPFLPAEVARAPAGHILARQTESVSWPRLFVVGTPCADRLDSEFLRGMARDAATVSRKILEQSRQTEPRAARAVTPTLT